MTRSLSKRKELIRQIFTLSLSHFKNESEEIFHILFRFVRLSSTDRRARFGEQTGEFVNEVSII